MTGTLRRAVVVDRFPLWIDAISAALSGLGVEVVEKATAWSDALHAVEVHKPELLITAIDFGEGAHNAFDAIGTALERHSEMKVIAMSADAEPETIDAALAGGASAVVMKSAHPDDLVAAVRQTFTHSVYYAHDRSGRQLRSAHNGNGRAGAGSEGYDPLGHLTRREIEILRLLTEGRSNAELAKQLWVTEQTVKFHLSNIYRKLAVKNRTQATIWAQAHGLAAEHAATSAA